MHLYSPKLQTCQLLVEMVSEKGLSSPLLSQLFITPQKFYPVENFQVIALFETKQDGLI